MRIVCLMLFLVACGREPEPVVPDASQAAPTMAPSAVVEAPPAPVVEVAEPTEWTVTLRQGESLALLSGWVGTTPEVLAEHNGLESTSLRRGAEVRLPGTLEVAERFTQRREAFERGRLGRYLTRHGQPKLTRRKVRRGESLSRIARRARVPLWMMLHYNADRDVDQLVIGDEVVVPKFSRRVARR